jgi:glutaconyl-CoA/methylmalonyl-CoA decarboxylase subunit delta
MKKFWLILSMLTCIFTMVACSSSQTTGKASFDYNEDTLISTTEQYLESWNTTDFIAILTAENMAQMDETTISMYKSWDTLQDKLGAFDSVTNRTVIENKDEVKVTFRGKYAKGQMDLTLTFTSAEAVSNIKAEEFLTMSKKMEDAVLNTILGLGIVFCSLIIISAVIGLFKFIPKLFNKNINQGSVDKQPSTIVENSSSTDVEESDISDDLELVAVITAAITASLGEEAPVNGLVVKSIRRKNIKQWKHA